MKRNQKDFIIVLLLLLFIGSVSGGPGLGAACTVVCTAGWLGCTGAGLSLAANPITAPFLAVLAPMFASGCGAGYSACMSACLASLFTPTL